MAKATHQIPTSTNHNGLSETNNPHHNELQPTPPVSPNNQQNNNSCLPRFPTTNDLQISRVRTNEQHDTSQHVPDDDQEFFRKNRGWLMIVAIQAVASTYQAGLSPPGSFWESDDPNGHHVAGNPILYDKFHARYHAFFYCNAISFVFSLVTVISLMNKHFYRNPIRIKVLKITIVLDLLSFTAAYAADSCCSISLSFIIFVLIGAVFGYVLLFAFYYSVLRNIARHARSRMRIREACVVRPEV